MEESDDVSFISTFVFSHLNHLLLSRGFSGLITSVVLFSGSSFATLHEQFQGSCLPVDGMSKSKLGN